MNDFEFKRRNPILIVFWALGLFILMHLVQYLAITVGALFSNHNFEEIISGQHSDHLTIFGHGLTLMAVGIPFAFLVVKYLWRRNKEWLCLRFQPIKLISGTALGLVFPVIIIVILYYFNTVQVTGYPDRFPVMVLGGALAGYMGKYLFAAIVEEIIFRAILAREMAERWGWPAAMIISGFIFGLLHILNLKNPDFQTILLMLGAAVVFSAMMTALYIRAKNLWLPIGFHFGWNFCLSAIMGTTMSASESGYGIYQTVITGPKLLTGGEFGMEASIVAIITQLIAVYFILRISIKGQTGLLNPRHSDSE